MPETQLRERGTENTVAWCTKAGYAHGPNEASWVGNSAERRGMENTVAWWYERGICAGVADFLGVTRRLLSANVRQVAVSVRR
jgi:hypothetical protein